MRQAQDVTSKPASQRNPNDLFFLRGLDSWVNSDDNLIQIGVFDFELYVGSGAPKRLKAAVAS